MEMPGKLHSNRTLVVDGTWRSAVLINSSIASVTTHLQGPEVELVKLSTASKQSYNPV